MSEVVGDELRAWREKNRWTQADVAEMLGVKRTRYANWESDSPVPPTMVKKLQLLGFRAEVGSPTAPATMPFVQVPTIGTISAGMKANWTDPYESTDWEEIPSFMADNRGTFSCRVESDSMMPLLIPGDLLIFVKTDMPPIGKIVLHRSPDNKLTIKTLRHDGSNYMLHPENPKYEPCLADGQCVGFLTGVIHEGPPVRLIHNPPGLGPKDF